MKLALKYSTYCKAVKTIAKIIVNKPPIIAFFLSPLIKAWCPYVIVDPLLNNKKVFNNGIPKADNASIPCGGHTPHISIFGLRLEWKNAQNTEKNANTSLTINKITPIVNPFCT